MEKTLPLSSDATHDPEKSFFQRRASLRFSSHELITSHSHIHYERERQWDDNLNSARYDLDRPKDYKHLQKAIAYLKTDLAAQDESTISKSLTSLRDIFTKSKSCPPHMVRLFTSFDILGAIAMILKTPHTSDLYINALQLVTHFCLFLFHLVLSWYFSSPYHLT